MRFSWKPLNTSILIKLLIMFFLVLLPLYTITWFINVEGEKSIHREITNSVVGRDRFYVDMIERDMERISNLLKEYIVDRDLQELSAIGNQLSDYQRTEMILRLQRRLHILKTSSTYIKEVRAFIPSIDRTVTSSSFESNISRDEFEALQIRNGAGANFFVPWDDRLFISWQYPFTVTSSPSFLLEVELSKEELKNTLENIVNEQQGGAMLLDLQQNWFISDERSPEVIASIKRYSEEQREKNVQQGLQSASIDGSSYIISHSFSSDLETALVVYVSEKEILGSLLQYKAGFKWLSLLSLLIIILFSFSIHRMIHRPLRNLVHAFRAVEQGNLQVRLNRGGKDEFGYLYLRFNQMGAHLQHLIHEVYEQRIRNQRAELKRLQSQINPHFLYNCFFVLYRIIKARNYENAYRFALYMGEYFKYITRNAADEISLSEEWDHARTYMEIQKICYGNRVDIDFPINAAPEIKNKVPRLIVQPIVENAFKHAIGKQISSARIRVQAQEEGDQLSIIVEDSGKEMDDELLAALCERLKASDQDDMEETTGLMNVHKRLKLKFGDTYGVYLSRSPLGGLLVELRMRKG